MNYTYVITEVGIGEGHLILHEVKVRDEQSRYEVLASAIPVWAAQRLVNSLIGEGDFYIELYPRSDQTRMIVQSYPEYLSDQLKIANFLA
jgi:hypothetical protein